MGESFARPFDLLLGRKTYEIFAAHWPYQEGEIADPFNATTKYVATSSAEPLAWQNSVRLEGDVPDAVARLKEGDGPDLLTQGSSVLVQSLLAAGLVDELFLLVFPVLLGKGKSWFGEDAKPGEWSLVDSRTSTTGVIIVPLPAEGPGPHRLVRARRAERGRARAAREDEAGGAGMTETATVERRAAYRRAARAVFDAWLDPDQAGRWLFRTPDGVLERCEIDAARRRPLPDRRAARRRPCRALWRICRDRPAAPARLRFLDQLQRRADAGHDRHRARRRRLAAHPHPRGRLGGLGGARPARAGR